MPADLGRLRHRRDHLGREIQRIGRHEADALDAVDGRHRAQQVAEAHVLVAIRIHRLSEQLHLFVAGLGHRARLAQHLARRRAALAPARVGDDAERAELVAAALDGDVSGDAAPGAVRRGPARGGFAAGHGAHARRVETFVGLEPVELCVLDRLAAARAVHVVQQPPVAVGADHHVDVGRLLADRALQMLGHAAGDAQDHAGARLVRREHARARVDLFLGLFAHGAGVEQDQIGARRIFGAPVARALQQAQNHLGVGDVHLAPVGLDVGQALRLRLRLVRRCSRTGGAASPQRDEVAHRHGPGL